MKRFAIMAFLGAMMCGSLMAGCGGSGDEDTTVANNATTGAMGGDSKAEKAAGADAADTP